MQQATQLQLSPNGQSLYQPQSDPSLQNKARTPCPQPQHEPRRSKESLPQELDKDKTVTRHIPRLRAVVESQAFKNVLVDEMDMILSRAATLIQANWRGYRLRQKLISQMMAAKAIQEAWRCFHTRRLLWSGKSMEKRVSVDEGDIPYHPPQQVRFQHPRESKSSLAQPIMVSKETQFPSSDSLAACTHQLAPQTQSTPQPAMQAPCTTGGPNVTFLPHQTVAIRLPCPVSLDAKCHPCLLTRTVRNACLVHVEGDTVKAKQVTGRANKSGAPGPPSSGRYAQAVHGSLKTQNQALMEAEVFKAPPQTGPAPVITKTLSQTYPVAAMTKTPPQPCVVPTGMIAKTPPQMYPAARMTKTPTQMYPAAAMNKSPPHTYPAATMTKTPIQSCLATMMNKTPPQPCSAPMVTITKTPPQMYQVGPVAKASPQTCPAAAVVKTSPQTSQAATVTKTPLQSCLAAMMNKTPPQPCPAAPVSKTPTQMRATASITNTSSQTRPAAMMAKISPQICLLASMIKPPTQTRPVPTVTKTPPQTCPVPTMAKTPVQMRPAAPMTKTPLQTCTAPAMAKTPSQTLTGASVTKTPPQTRLAAMVTKTPAQFRSVAAIIRTLCLPPPTAGNLKPSPPATVAAGIPNTSSHMYLNGPKAKAVMNAKQTGMVKVSSHSYLAEGKVKYFPPPHLGAGTPKAPARPPLEAEKLKAFSQKQVKTETVSNPSAAVEIPRASPWTKVAEDRNKSSLKTHLRTDVVKVQSQVYVPVETAVAVPRGQLATCPAKALDTCVAKALPQERLVTTTTTTSPQGQLLAELTTALPQAHQGTCLSKTLPQAHPSTKLTKALSQGHPSAELPTAEAQSHLGTGLSKTLSQRCSSTKVTKTPSFAHLGTCLTKTQSQAHLATGAIKIQSQAHLPTGLTKAQSQARLVTETAKCLYATHQPAELCNKTQSQPLLAGFKASSQPCQHVGAFGTLPQAKPGDRLTQIQPHSNAQGKVTQGPCQGASEPQSMLVPLLASAGHPTCNVESWDDSGATRSQPSMADPVIPCQEELTASQLASLCAELAAELGSQEDLRALLAKALSQGQVRAALNQALTKKILGATVAKALPQGMLGTALMKVLSWGELGLALSRTLTPTELRAELTKAKQGKLADVLSKALTEEELAALSQALCQGELGAVLSQSLSQAALRTGVVLPKAISKTAGSRMTVMPAPVEVGNPSAAWGPSLGPVRPQPSKVRVPQDGAWGGFFTGRPAGFLAEMGDGAMLGGSPCLSVVSMGASLTLRVITAVHQYSLIVALAPTLSWEMDPSRHCSSNLYLNPEVSEENVYLLPGASELASELSPMESDTGPKLPKPPHLQPLPSLWQPLIANGVGPSTSQPSLAGGTAPSSHKPHVSRVAPHPSKEGRVAPGTPPHAVGGGRASHSHQCVTTYRGSVCWCQPSGVNKVPPRVFRSSTTKVPRQPSVAREETRQKTQSSNHKRASMDPRERINKVTSGPQSAASVSKVPLTQPQIPKACDITLGLLPGSVAPGHHWALKTQGDPSVFQASPGSGLARTLPGTAIPQQERNRTKGAISSAHHPREQMTGHTPNELVASLPQGLDNDPFGSLSQGSTDCGPNASNSQSSLPSCSSLSLSTMSAASLTAVDLVEEESWEASLGGDIRVDTLLSGEAVGSRQGPRDREETRKASRQHTTPNLHHPPFGSSELIPILYHSSVSGCVTLSVHWGSDDQDERDMSLGQSSMNLKEILCQKSYRTGLTRSVSLGNVVPTVYQRPRVATRLASSLSQPSLLSKMSPNPQYPFGVSRVPPSLSESSMASKLTPSPTEPSMASKVTPSLAWPSMASKVTPRLAWPSVTNGGTPSLALPSVTGGMAPHMDQASVSSRVAPRLAQSSVTGGVAPRLAQPSVTGGVAPRLAQTSVTGGVAPNLVQAFVTSRVAPNLAQPSVTSRVAPNLAQASMTSGVAPSLAQPSVTSRVAPNLAQPPVTGGVAPSLAQPSMTGGVALNLVQPSVTGGLAPNLAQASVTSRVAPSLAQPSMTAGVAPNLMQASMTGRVAPSLTQLPVTGGVAPSLGQPSVTRGVAPNLAQPSMTSVVAPSLAQPSVTSGMAPSLAQPFVTSGMTPSLAWPSVTSGVTPSLAWPSVTSVVTPSLAQPSMTSGMAPSLAQPSVTSGVAPSLAQPSVTSGVAPSPAQPSVTSGVAPSLAQPSVTSGVAPSLAQPSVTSGVTPSLAWPSVISGVTPSLAQPSVTSGVVPKLMQASVTSRVTHSLTQLPVTGRMAPSLAQPSVTSGVAPSLAWPSVTSGVAPTLMQTSVTSRVAPSLTQPPMTGGVAPSLMQASVTGRVAPSLAQPSVTGGVAPSLAQPSVTGGVPPSLAQPSVTGGVAPSLAQPSVTGGVAPSLAQPSVTSRVAPSLTQLPMTGGVAPSLAQPSVTGGVAPSLAQPSVTGGVAPSLAQPSMTGGVTPSLTQPSVTDGVAPSLAQPSATSEVALSLAQLSVTSGVAPSLAQLSVTSGVAPSLAQPSVACVVAPRLAQPSVACVVAPSLAQPSVACVVAPSLAQPSVACVVAPSLAQTPVASRGPLSLLRPPVISGSCAAGQSSWAPKVGSKLPSSRVNAVAPSLRHPSFVTEVTPSTPYPSGTSSMGQGLSQSSVTPGVDPCQDPVMVSGVASNPQAPEFSKVSLAFHQPLGVSGRHPRTAEHSAFALSAPNLYQVPVASGEDSCLAQGTTICPEALFRGMATSMCPGTMMPAGMFPNMSRGTLAAGMFLSVSPGPMSPGMAGSMCQRSVATGVGPNQFQVASGMIPTASPASVAGAPLIREQPSEVGPGFSQASVPNRLGMSPFKFSQASVGPSRSQVNVDFPIPLNPQHPSVSTIVAPGYQQANAFSQVPVMGTASGLVPGSVASRMTTTMAPGTVASGVAPSLPPGSVIRGVGQSLPPGPVISEVPPHLPPGYMVSGVAQPLPPGSVICGISHSLPPGSVISDVGQGLPPDPMPTGVAQSFPLGSVASGMAGTLPPASVVPTLIATTGAGEKRQRLPVRPSVSFTAPSLVPGSVASEVAPSVSPESVASRMVPASMAGGLNQGLVLGSRASAAGLPSTVGNVAQRLPQGSTLIGATPRPYQGSLAGDGSIAPFQASRAPGLAQLHPQAVEASGTTRGVHQMPTVLQRASQLSHRLGMMPFETTDDQVMMKPESLEKALSQVSVSSRESMVLEATPWMPHSLLPNDINHSLNFLPNCQRPLLEEVVPSETKSLTSGMASVPPQSLNIAKHLMAGGTLQQRSVTTWGVPSSHFVTASRVPSVYMESVKATGALLTHQQATVAHVSQSPSVALIVSQNPSVAHVPRSPSVAHIVPQNPSVDHVPQSHAHEMGASTIVSGSPKLARGSTLASSLHPGSIVGMGSPSTSQRPGATSVASHVPLHLPMVSGVASGGFQMEAVPSMHQKPGSGDPAQTNHKFPGSKKSYRSMHGSFVSEMLDDNVARIVPSHEVWEHAYRSSQDSPERSAGAPPATPPIICTEAAHNVATTPRLHPGFRRVSLGFESSPSGSRKPLLIKESVQGSQDFHSAMAPVGSHRAPLTPTVLQGPVDAGIAGDQAWNSAVPSVAAGPMNSAGAPSGPWELARAPAPWDTAGREAAADPRQSGELVASMQAMEKMIIRAVVTIQACARGYLVRRTIKVWHQWAMIIQATWRGYCVRRDLARLSRAATLIQALWRGFCIRRAQTQPALLPGPWAEMGHRSRPASDHRCFQSCQPHVCTLCQSLSPRVGSPPSVVMLVGSSPRTCHMCGHTLPTRVVHGMGRGAIAQAGVPWGCVPQKIPRSPRLSRRQNKAAMAIQSAWRGFTVRRQLRQQQVAAKMLQATWRGHHTRANLTTDALLTPAPWDNPHHVQWPGF